MLGEILMTVAEQPAVLALLIVAATFVLEDAATVAVSLLASQMVIDAQIALFALTLGTVAGDLALYVFARWAGDSRLVRRLGIGRAPVGRAIGWLRSHALLLTVVARFTPGLRLPVYAGAGAAKVRFAPFAIVVTASALVWTPGLFWAASALDPASFERLGMWGWPVAAGLAGVLLLGSRVTGRLLVRSGP